MMNKVANPLLIIPHLYSALIVSSSLLTFRKQAVDDLLLLIVKALADVREAYASVLVEDDDGGPRLNPVCVPRRGVVINDDRIFDLQLIHRAPDVLKSAFAVEFRRLHADDG